MKHVLIVENICKSYGSGENEVKAIKNISFTIEEGEMTAIMGPSGSGKTTLLNVLSTIDTIDQGSIKINDESIEKLNEKKRAKFRKQRLGFIFQDFNLLDTLTIYENIELVLSINHYPAKKIPEYIKGMAEKLGIQKILNKYPYEVSGGQKQRCACARAIINNPDLVLADEPTGALDSNATKNLMEMLKEMNHMLKTTILIVTHDANVASYCKRVLIIKDGSLFEDINEDINYNNVLNIMAKCEGGRK